MKFLFAVLLLTIYTLPSASAKIVLKEVSIRCSVNIYECDVIKKRSEAIKGNYRNIEHIKKNVSTIFADGGFLLPFYTVRLEGDNASVEVDAIFKNKIRSIKYFVDGRDQGSGQISLAEGESFSEKKVQETRVNLKKIFEDKGYPESKVEIKVRELEGNVDIEIFVERGSPRILKEIRILGANEVSKKIITKKLSPLLKNPFSFSSLKKAFDELKVYFSSYGFYLFDYSVMRVTKGPEVSLDIMVNQGSLLSYHFVGNEPYKRKELVKIMERGLKRYKRELDPQKMEGLVSSFFKENGYVDVEVDVFEKRFEDASGVSRINYKIVIQKNDKRKYDSVVFLGNTQFSDQELLSLYWQKAYDLAASNYVDEKYYEEFKNILYRKYLQNGYINPSVSFDLRVDRKEKKYTVEFRVEEGPRAIISKVNLIGLEENIDLNSVLEEYSVFQGKPFNPILFKSFIEATQRELKNKGYYFAEISSPENFITYNDAATRVNLNIEIDLGEKIVLDKIIIVGNKKTKEKIIRRRVEIQKGELITLEEVDRLRYRISRLGLFSSVLIKPIYVKGYGGETDLIIEVKERTYGLVEVAPGFRTDLGYKISSGISYQNLNGMNRTLSIFGQVNERENLNTLDLRRRTEARRLIEYSVRLNYSDNDIQGWNLDYNAGLSTEEKRFFTFDARIFRFNNTFKKYWSRRLSTSLRYQFETIEQFDATEEKDRGTFQIGSLTPSLTLDYRDRKINPSKGFISSLSYEMANPSLLSQTEPDTVVDYYKIVNRNRIYFNLSDSYGLAIYSAFGMQKNLATELARDSSGNTITNSDGELQTVGNIPSIKVFRLAGTDIVRGFDEEEINRVDSGEDITEITIQDAVYFTNIKIEPRYYFSDNIIIGFFLDGGRVFVNSYRMFDLRTSAGISFKYLTPVGTLDFDYGLKLKREEISPGNFESPGRLHISIGFF